MAELVTCQTETNLCSVCGRSRYQTSFCTLVKQAVGTFSYIQDAQEERAAGPHIV
jgi:hypothetical protein